VHRRVTVAAMMVVAAEVVVVVVVGMLVITIVGSIDSGILVLVFGRIMQRGADGHRRAVLQVDQFGMSMIRAAAMVTHRPPRIP
jgi:hypothetical protein